MVALGRLALVAVFVWQDGLNLDSPRTYKAPSHGKGPFLMAPRVGIRRTRRSELPWFPSWRLGTRVREQTCSANVYL